MKITKRYLKQLIKEEIKKIVEVGETTLGNQPLGKETTLGEPSETQTGDTQQATIISEEYKKIEAVIIKLNNEIASLKGMIVFNKSVDDGTPQLTFIVPLPKEKLQGVQGQAMLYVMTGLSNNNRSFEVKKTANTISGPIALPPLK